MTMKSVDNIKNGARLPAKKNGKTKKKLSSPKFNREIPKPRIMNPSAITYSSLNFKCDSPQNFGNTLDLNRLLPQIAIA